MSWLAVQQDVQTVSVTCGFSFDIQCSPCQREVVSIGRFETMYELTPADVSEAIVSFDGQCAAPRIDLVTSQRLYSGMRIQSSLNPVSQETDRLFLQIANSDIANPTVR